MRPVRLIFFLCLAEILAMTPFATFPALTPHFFDAWAIGGSEAGWINGIFFLGFTLFGLFASTLTDRVDARRIVLFGIVLSIIGAAGFAAYAVDFETALPWRFMSGAALACCYMPGLKLLTDRLPIQNQPRAIAFYTACFSTGSAVSFLLVGQVNTWFGAETAIYSALVGPPFALLITVSLTRAKAHMSPRHWRQLLNFKPVLSNKKTMGYVIAYFCHSWELMAMRSFVVAFLTFAHLQSDAPVWMDVSIIASIVIFMGLPSSVMGNELALRIGRPKAIILIMMCGFVMSVLLGFSASWPFSIVAALAIIYGVFVTADSSSLTSGSVISSPIDLKGSTMAVHSFIGFTGAMLGPVVAGMALEAGGGHESSMAWGLTFISMGFVSLIGPFALRMSR
jgi:MFS family permease